MCGIGTITLGKSAPLGLDLDAAVAAMLLDLDHRGGDATGLLTISAGGRIDIQKAVCDAKEFGEYRSPVPANTRALAVHTRFATQGPQSFNRNNHPIICGQAYVMHNGIIWDAHLKRTPGQPEVDTYALAVVADAVGRRRKGETAQSHGERIAAALADEEGSAAVAVALRSQPFLVTARLAHSPLYVAEMRGVRIAASTETAVSEGFYALGIELVGREVKKSNGKKGRKYKTWTEWTEDIDYAPEGAVYSWDAGMHGEGRITLPDHLRPNHLHASQSFARPYAYSESEGHWDTRYEDIAAHLLAKPSEDIDWARCETCDTYAPSDELRTRWAMRVCGDCEAAFAASGADQEDEVQA